MCIDEMPHEAAMHATALVLGAGGLLITGVSGAGKSRLALSLLAVSTRGLPIHLVGDDRVLLTRRANDILVRGHPRIQGFIEARGFGIIACPFVDRARAVAVVQIGPRTPWPSVIQNLPCLSIVTSNDIAAERERVLAWWRGAHTTPGAKRLGAA